MKDKGNTKIEPVFQYMTRINSLIIFFITISLELLGQSKLDSLKNALRNVKSEIEEVQILTHLSIDESTGNLEQSKIYALLALEKAKRVGFKKGLANAHYALGLYFDYNIMIDSALYHYEIAADLYKAGENLKGEANAYTGIGYVYMALANYEKAVGNILKGLKLREELGDRHAMAGSYVALGNLFNEESGFDSKTNVNNLKKSLSYHKQALKIYIDEQDDREQGNVLNNLANLYVKLGKLDSAILMNRQSMAIAKKYDSKLGLAINYNNMGNKFHKIKKYDSAAYYLSEAINLYEGLNNQQGQIIPYTNLCKISFARENYDQAIAYAWRAQELAESLNDRVSLAGTTKILSDVYAKTGDYKRAYELFGTHKAYTDSVYDKKRAKEMADLELAYDTERKEQQIASLEQENNLALLRRNILIGSIVTIVIVALLLYFQQLQRNKRNLILLQKEKEVDRMKSKFFTNISHELRTPLTMLIGPIHEIRKSTTDEKTRLYLDMMQQSTSRLLTQVNQLLDLSKIDSGQLKLRVEKFNLVPFVKGVVLSFESLAASREISFRFQCTHDHIDFYGDRDSIEKMVANLVTNALKFSGKNDSVSVSLHKTLHDVEIAVADTGKGFDEEVAEHLFERYYHTESDMQASTGIGLALVKELVERHSGSIVAHGKKGTGSTFTIFLPLGKKHWTDIPADLIKKVDIVPELQEESITLLPSESIAPESEVRILIIEDNDDVRLFIGEILKEKYTLLEASNGETGLKLAQETIPDLIITDIMMPKMDGYEVTAQLKNNVKTCHIPVVMLTAKADLESKMTGLQAEADDYLIKPFEGKELLTRISNLISLREKLKIHYSKSITLQSGTISINSMDEAFLGKIVRCVEDNMDNDKFGVEVLGQSIGMSRSQIHRKVQALTGIPPNQFIRNIRLTRAMELLKNNAGTVAEIAYMTGFGTPNYFSKCFSDKFGYTPGEVKKQAS